MAPKLPGTFKEIRGLDVVLPFGPSLDGLCDPSADLEKFVESREQELAARLPRPAVWSADEVHLRQEEVRSAAEQVLGGRPDCSAPSAEDLREITGAVAGCRIQSFDLVEGDGYRIPGDFYIPAGLSEPAPAVLILCGHSSKTRPQYVSLAVQMALKGIAALVTEPFGQGERLGYVSADGLSSLTPGMNGNEAVLQHNVFGARAWATGYSPARDFVSDAMVALEFLRSHSLVDKARVGATGVSGGGAILSWLMMLDADLAAAAPVIVVSDRTSIRATGISQDAEQIVLGGSEIALDHDDYLLSMAPRPVLVASATSDFFPIWGARRSVSEARKAYTALGSPDALEHVECSGSHALSRQLQLAICEFFARRLEPSQGSIHHLVPEDNVITLLSKQLERSQLAVRYPTAPTPITRQLQRARSSPFVSPEEARAWVTGVVRKGERKPVYAAPRWTASQRLKIAGRVWAVDRATWLVDAGLSGSGSFARPLDRQWNALKLDVSDRGSATSLRQLEAHPDHAVLSIDLRGQGPLLPRVRNWHGMDENYGTQYLAMTELLWLGDSLAAGRVRDVLTALAICRTDSRINLDGRRVEIEGSGFGAFTAAVAAVIDGQAELLLEDEPWNPENFASSLPITESTAEWQNIIPGMASRAPLTVLLKALESKPRFRHNVPGKSLRHGRP